MKIVKVKLGKRSYKIYIGKNITGKLSSLIDLPAPNTPLFVVTNKKINARHGAKIKKALKPLSNKILFYEVPDSERAKSFPVYIKTIRALARFSRKTKPFVFALGGGVVGDLAGFVASAYRRGVPYAQIPTTLLAQVDSAIGGKVAIDIKEAKNIVGDFYQPKMVISDIALLSTLPEKELRNGLVEVVKYGIIKDKKLFNFLEHNTRKILKCDYKALEHIISRSSNIKASVVGKDEFDVTGVRAILNFGHTVGHAMEAASRYSESITHGQAVAAGMIVASLIALEKKMISCKDYKRICALVKKVAVKIKLKGIRGKDIFNALSYDKKFTHGTNRFILPKKIGLVTIVDKVPESLIKEAIENSFL